jgi:gamma-glutamyltranspeptidase / glutathione hydrolase
LAGAFGSGVAVREYGIILQNRATGFTLKRGSPDALAPHKRPFSYDHSGLHGER